MRRRPPNTKPWLVQVKRKFGGRTQSLISLHRTLSLLKRLRAEEKTDAILEMIERNESSAEMYRRWADRKRYRTWIHGGAHYCYCIECGKRDSINNMVTRKNVDMANRENYCIACAQRKGIQFWTSDRPIPELDNYDFYI